jgi:small conductance mechanosensitive channel
MSDRTVTAIVTGAAGVALVLLVRWILHVVLRRWLRVLETRRSAAEAASMRTRLALLERLVVAFLVLIVAWQVLSVYPETGRLANAVLASGAIVALLVGLAFTTPLSNLGAGILLAFTQPVRIGDRITVEGASGTVTEITLIHTVLSDEDDRRVFIPNSRMVASVVVNRTLVDPRETVDVEVPVRLDAPLERARAVVTEAARAAGPAELEVRVGSVGEKIAWLHVSATGSETTDAEELAGELRERAVVALAREQLLPG